MHHEFHCLIDSMVEKANDLQLLSHQQATDMKLHAYCVLAAALHRGNSLLARRMFQIPSVDDLAHVHAARTVVVSHGREISNAGYILATSFGVCYLAVIETEPNRANRTGTVNVVVVCVVIMN